MSGTIAGVLGAYNGVTAALAGPAVTLGSVGFQGLEVPAAMPWGGDQKLVIHELTGGGRVVDVLGAQESDIDWSGYFTGPSAVARARQVDVMRVAGKKVRLTWADFSRMVVIKTFRPDYSRSGTLVSYRIICVVVPGITLSASKPTLLGQLGSDLSSALDLPALLPAATQAVSLAQAALPIGSLLTGGSPAFIALSGVVGTAQGAVSTAASLADTQLAGVASAAPTGSVFGGAAGLLAASAAQDALASATQALGYVGRAAKNLVS